jgi:hypothetical protein
MIAEMKKLCAQKKGERLYCRQNENLFLLSYRR